MSRRANGRGNLTWCTKSVKWQDTATHDGCEKPGAPSFAVAASALGSSAIPHLCRCSSHSLDGSTARSNSVKSGGRVSSRMAATMSSARVARHHPAHVAAVHPLLPGNLPQRLYLARLQHGEPPKFPMVTSCYESVAEYRRR